jgi:hypothetical protein
MDLREFHWPFSGVEDGVGPEQKGLSGADLKAVSQNDAGFDCGKFLASTRGNGPGLFLDHLIKRAGKIGVIG